MSADRYDEDLIADLLAEVEGEAEEEDRDEHEDRDEAPVESAKTSNHDPRALQDAHVAQTVADRSLRGRYCWTAGLNWMAYARGLWAEATEASVAERVRRDLIDQHAREAKAGAEADRLRQLSSLMSAARIRAIVGLARGILEVDSASFDQHPDLLNVTNGVVDLATGELLPHHPGLFLTKVTGAAYEPEATSPDWMAALKALPPEVAAWMQIRFGQAVSGHPTPDDVMPVAQGGGANGKTTVTGTLVAVLGGHAGTIPERVLMANSSDHPTELMTLRGMRFALIEETPEARHLSVKRLKDTVGTPTMTARLIGRNNVTWTVTHSLFLTTNYRPRVDETDHGTWRRLALVRFPYRFTAPDQTPAARDDRRGDAGLRERCIAGRQGQHEAALAWLVEGARLWYAHDRVMPPAPKLVRDDTQAWRVEADLVCAYLVDRLVFDPESHILATEMYGDFTGWVVARGHRAWADQTLSTRFETHGIVEGAKVEKQRTSARPGLSRSGVTFEAPPARYMAWTGVRFRTSADDRAEESGDEKDQQTAGAPSDGQASDQQIYDPWQGWQGYSGVPHEGDNIEMTRPPLPPLPQTSFSASVNQTEPAERADTFGATSPTDAPPATGDYGSTCQDCGGDVPPGHHRCQFCRSRNMDRLTTQPVAR